MKLWIHKSILNKALKITAVVCLIKLKQCKVIKMNHHFLIIFLILIKFKFLIQYLKYKLVVKMMLYQMIYRLLVLFIVNLSSNSNNN